MAYLCIWYLFCYVIRKGIMKNEDMAFPLNLAIINMETTLKEEEEEEEEEQNVCM